MTLRNARNCSSCGVRIRTAHRQGGDTCHTCHGDGDSGGG